MSSDPWGRVDETGTVYVRTADGEQVVGSWQAGSPEEALAYFERKYDGIVVEIGLLERRVKTTDLSAKDATTAIDHLRQQVDEHHAVGDLDALRKRLDALLATVEAAPRSGRFSASNDEAKHAKEALVTEAEELAQSEQWRSAGERLRALVDTWKGLPRLDRKSDDELWHRFSHARSAFSKRRKAHFAALDAQREDARKAKEKLVTEAEALSGSTDWVTTAARYRDLMTEWSCRGPRPARVRGRPVEPLPRRPGRLLRRPQRGLRGARRRAGREPQAQGGARHRGREAGAGEGPEGGPCRLPGHQRALGGHRPRTA
ncbi:hypothetical protein SGRIM128S_05634 [Streptomyces griseomycini]